VQRTGRRLVRELADGVGDPAPDDLTVVIVADGELVGARGAFLERFLAVALGASGWLRARCRSPESWQERKS
jgi:hypothetical protein